MTAELQASLADVSSIVQESLSVSGILLGKTMGRSGDLAERFGAESSRLADLEVRSRMTGRWMMAAIQTTFAVMPALVYWFAGWTMANGSGAITIGTLVAFTTLQARLFFPIGSLLGVQVDVQSSLALFDRIFEYLDQPVEIEEGTRALERPAVRSPSSASGSATATRPGRSRTSRSPFPPGRRPPSSGETGSGKTTCAYLVARLYDATEGQVTIDGVDVRDLTFESLAAAVGVVSQETYLFHASVRENLRFARPEATDAEIEEAARAAQVHDLIASLPEGYDTVVGERGYRFSGGEKQRIAIARTILAIRPSSSSTRPRPRSTRRPSWRCRTRSSVSPRGGRRSRSPTGSRPSATPTRSSSSTTGGWSRSARTTSCSPAGALRVARLLGRGRPSSLYRRDLPSGPCGRRRDSSLRRARRPSRGRSHDYARPSSRPVLTDS